MNEYVLYALAQVAITFAGFSGVVVAFRLRGAEAWSPKELRILWLLLGDTFLVLFFSLLPVALALANCPPDFLWGFCNALLGSWFIIADILAMLGERRDKAKGQVTNVPVITPILYVVTVMAIVMGVALWLSVFDLVVHRGEAVFVFGLITLLGFAALEFLFFIGLVSQQGRNKELKNQID
jgi:hypothetical protein